MSKTQIYSFGAFRLDPARRMLFREGYPIPLTPRAFDTLVALVSDHGKVISKDELLQAVWGETFVEENNLSQSISALRKSLGDDGNGNRYIATVPRKGYCFVASVTEIDSAHAIPTPGVERKEPSDASPPIEKPAQEKRRRPPLVWALVAILVLVSGAVAAAWIGRARQEREAIPRIRSIAVLPLKQLSRASRDEYLGLALADSLITRLGRIEKLSVRPTAAVRSFGSETQDPVSAGRALAVEAVLDGQVQRLGDRIRVTVQLIDVSTGAALWTDKIDVESGDLFAVEDAISENLASRLASDIPRTAVARRPAGRATSREAYEAYLRGRFEWNKRTEEGFLHGAALFEQAVGLDPRYAAAYAGLADCRNFLANAPAAKRAANRAIELDPDLAEAHAALGNAALFYDYDRPGAERQFRDAIRLNRSYATAHQWLAYCLVSLRRFDEALDEIRQARAIDPFSPSIATDVGDILLYARRYDDAARECRKAIEMDPHFLQGHVELGQILKAKGDFEGAIREFALSERKDLLASAYALSGRRDEARRLLAEISAIRPGYAGGWQLLASLGERDRAFASLA